MRIVIMNAHIACAGCGIFDVIRTDIKGDALMGPFPHDRPQSKITDENPAGTDGFEFVEFAHPEPEELRKLFASMGYEKVARHKEKDIELWQQGDITYVVNAEPGSLHVFEHAHGIGGWGGGGGGCGGGGSGGT